MTRTVARGFICVLAAVALFYLVLALGSEFGIKAVPIGFGTIDITPGSLGPARIGMIWTGITVMLFVIERLTLRQA